MIRGSSQGPNVPGASNILAGEGTIQKGIRENVLDDAKPQAIVSFSISEDWPSSIHSLAGVCSHGRELRLTMLLRFSSLC